MVSVFRVSLSRIQPLQHQQSISFTVTHLVLHLPCLPHRASPPNKTHIYTHTHTQSFFTVTRLLSCFSLLLHHQPTKLFFLGSIHRRFFQKDARRKSKKKILPPPITHNHWHAHPISRQAALHPQLVRYQLEGSCSSLDPRVLPHLERKDTFNNIAFLQLKSHLTANSLNPGSLCLYHQSRCLVEHTTCPPPTTPGPSPTPNKADRFSFPAPKQHNTLGA
jgi:hypothetical protein